MKLHKQNYRTTTVNNKTKLCSRLTWEKLRGPIPEGYIIHHIAGDISNDRIENLECISRSKHNKIHWSKRPKVKRKPLRMAKKRKNLFIVGVFLAFLMISVDKRSNCEKWAGIIRNNI